MLESLRKFSSSIYAKIFLGIIIIPFVFWGMGPVFQSGKQNSIVVIGKEKIPTQEFIEYIKYYVAPTEKLDENSIEKALPNFIIKKLIVEEIEDLDIRVSDNSLSKIIKNEKIFKKGNTFSRTEYEKYLVENNLNASSFEQHLLKQKKKEHLFDFIGGGIVPSNFLVNLTYDRINQKRNIQIINLNDVFNKRLNFSENQIKSYFNQNKDNYKKLYKSVRFIKLTQKNLTGNDEFTDLFFKKIDEIDDLIAEGKKLDFILEKFSLGFANSATFDILGKNKRAEMVDNFPTELIKNIFDVNKTESTVLIEHKDKYFILEINKTENVQRELSDVAVKKEVLLNLQKEAKRKLIVEIIDKINKNNFKKYDFDKLSMDESVAIKKVKLESQNDNKLLKKELIDQIYQFSEKKIVVVMDIDLSENFLVYIDKIEKVSIGENTEEYKKYFDLSKIEMRKDLYNTYDSYLKNKYKIDINYKALDGVKNYFR